MFVAPLSIGQTLIKLQRKLIKRLLYQVIIKLYYNQNQNDNMKKAFIKVTEA